MPAEYLLRHISHATLCLLMSSFMADIRIRIRIRFRALLKKEKKTTAGEVKNKCQSLVFSCAHT